MSLQPATYEEALERAQKRPQKPRQPLKRGKLARKTALRSKSSLAPAKRKKKVRRLTDGQLKKRVWKEFSIFIRTEGADALGFNQCITCQTRLHWKQLQAGHFIRGRLNSNLFDERGCHPQCYSCNIHRQGNVVIYYKIMLKKYGQKVIDELLEQNNKTHKWQAGELQNLLDHYKTLNKSIKQP